MDTTADQTLQESCMGALRHMSVEVTALVDKTNRLEHENARLRELARRMWPFAKSYLGMLPALGINDTESFDIYLEMRKLGVEEDE